MTPLVPLGAAAFAAFLLFRKKLAPAPRIIPVPPIVPQGQLPNYSVNGAAATAALNLSNYLGAKGCDAGIGDLVKSFQLSHNQDSAGDGPASMLGDRTGPLVVNGEYDAKTAFCLYIYMNGLAPFHAPCSADQSAILEDLNLSAQALYKRLTTSGCAGSSGDVLSFQGAWNAVGLPHLDTDGRYGKASAVALAVTIGSLLAPMTMTAPQRCV